MNESTMSDQTLSLSGKLALLGFGTFLLTGAWTALIPVLFAILFAAFALLARRPGLHMHAMHGVALLALLGGLAGLGMGGRGVFGLLSGTGRPLAVLEQLFLGVLCAEHLKRCVDSFRAARLRQAAAEA